MKKRNLRIRINRRLAFAERVQPDGTLSVVVGGTPLPRSEVLRRLWDYICRHRLQDAHRKLIINADENLREIFGGRAQISMFELTNLISAHLLPQRG